MASSPMRFYLGCALWGYQGWVGALYPSGSRSSDFLRLYGQRLSAVEGNSTFYAVPSQRTLARWASEVPPGFAFCPKLPQAITHAGRLVPQLDRARQFIDRMQALGDRLGPTFAQLPPAYSPQARADLEAFLAQLPGRDVPLAVEVRHPDWFVEPHASALDGLLQQAGVGRVLLDTRPIYQRPDDLQVAAERRKPQLPLQPSVTAPFSLVRFISHPEPALNQPFWAEWAQRLRDWLQAGTRVYWFMHCPVEARSPHHARRFHTTLGAWGAPVPPLPWERCQAPPEQLRLF